MQDNNYFFDNLSMNSFELNNIESNEFIQNNFGLETKFTELLSSFSFPYCSIFDKAGNNDNIKNIVTIKKEIETKKRRRKKGDVSISDKKRKNHDKFDRDNIKRKVQVHFLKFLVNFINKSILEIIKKYNNFNINDNDKNFIDKIQFKPLDYNFSKNITSASFNSLKSKNIKEIFKENTSPKFKKYNNKDIYNNIIEINKDIELLLNSTYLEFFKVFYESQSIINLRKYGFDLDINLDDIKKFDAFCEEQEKDDNFEQYINRINNCIKRDFIIKKFLPFRVKNESDYSSK